MNLGSVLVYTVDAILYRGGEGQLTSSICSCYKISLPVVWSIYKKLTETKQKITITNMFSKLMKKKR